MELVERDDPRVIALAAALAPCAWWSATPAMLARRASGVLDRHGLLGVLPGPRTAVHWRAFTRTALCRQLVGGLEAWSVRRRGVDVELGWLLDGGA